MYKEIQINQFRQFNNVNIKLGKYLTVIAGRNATGKSTILGLLANSGEIKKKDGSTYLNRQFRAEFSEILHGSKKFDDSGSNKIRINIVDNNDNEIDYRFFRTTWQKNGDKQRFRLIPSKTLADGKKTEAKLHIPILYLGLSRLFPIGEAEESNISTNNIKFFNSEHKNWFIEKYKYILSINEKIVEISNYSIGETDKKKGVGIETNNYDYLTISSGQDNLGQILLAILSFKKLKKENSSVSQGLLIIDEVDATLHPSAQERLIDLLIQEAKLTGFQVVITTHSSDLLKYICSKIKHNNNDINNNIELYYFTNANRKLEIKRNIDYSFIEGDLRLQSIIQNPNKIKVYTEDEENRWFFRHLTDDYLKYLDILNVSMGCQSLLGLFESDPTYFGNSLIVLDGDVKDSAYSEAQQILKSKMNNIVKLPGNVRPEEVFYNYIINLDADHPFWKKSSELNMTWQYFNDCGPKSKDYNKYGKDREKYKAWFKNHQNIFDGLKLFDFWKNDNKDLVDKFIISFIESYNAIADRAFSIKIKK